MNSAPERGANRPRSLHGDLRHLPTALAPLMALAHWVVWLWKRSKTGKWTKVPYQPNGKKAKNNDPKTWSTYDAVLQVLDRFDGIGFCLLNSGIAAFDLDDCRDQETGAIDPWARDLVARVASYVEITVSGTGLRIIGRGTGPRVQRKQQVNETLSCETYRRAERYIVMTGNPLADAPRVLSEIDAHIDRTVTELDEAAKAADKHKHCGVGDPPHATAESEDTPLQVDELENLIRNGCGTRFGGDRSKAVWHVANEMLRRGYLANSIVATLLDTSNRISEHIYDQDAPRVYAERQVADAIREIDFDRDENGKPKSKSQSNTRVALLKMGVSVRHDQFADRVLVDGLRDFGPTLDDRAVDRLWLQIDQRFRFAPAVEFLIRILQDTARLNSFHPVRACLDGLPWDREPRIDNWLTAYAGAEDTEYTRAIGALLLIAAIRRVRRPGSKYDEIVVLESEQGTNKSSALKLLAVREDWFADDLPLNSDGKRVIEQLRGRWIVEAAELSGMRRTEIEHLKAFLSRDTDRARMSYDRLVTEVPRQCVIVGTTNSDEYLRDLTGNRRFWPVRVRGFDLDTLRRDRDQLWAEAAVREGEGASIRLDARLWPVAAEQQALRVTEDPYFEALQGALDEMEGKIAATAVWEILEVKAGHRSQDQNNRMNSAMRRLGWRRPNESGVARIGGKVVSAFVKGEQPWRKIDVQHSEAGLLVVSYRDVC